MHRKFTLPTLVCAISLAFGSSVFAQAQVEDAVQAQTDILQTSIEIQNRINALDDGTREMLNEYRQTMTQVTDLAAYNEQLEGLEHAQVVLARIDAADRQDVGIARPLERFGR